MGPETPTRLQARSAREQYVDFTVVAGYREFFVLLAAVAALGIAMVLTARRVETTATHADTIVQSIRPAPTVGMPPTGRIPPPTFGDRHEQYSGPKRRDIQGGTKRTTG
jgi:hypothetical protein